MNTSLTKSRRWGLIGGKRSTPPSSIFCQKSSYARLEMTVIPVSWYEREGETTRHIRAPGNLPGMWKLSTTLVVMGRL